MTMTRFNSTFDDPHKTKRDDDDEFAFDHVMGRFNRHESFRADPDPVLYKDPRTKPREKTNANLVLWNIDD